MENNYIVLELTRERKEVLFDIVYEILEERVDNIEFYWGLLPNDILVDIQQYGINDSPTKDNIYVHLCSVLGYEI